jgi:hypothetical protein
MKVEGQGTLRFSFDGQKNSVSGSIHLASFARVGALTCLLQGELVIRADG